MLGVFGGNPQSDSEMLVSKHTISVIAARDHEVNRENINIIGWFDVDEDHPDRQFGDTIYVQAIELEYDAPARAIYGITDEGKVHLWAN